MDSKNIHITGGTKQERDELREWIAKALDDRGVFVTIVCATGGYEYNHLPIKARRADGFAMGDVHITTEDYA